MSNDQPTTLPRYGARYRLIEPAPERFFLGEALLLDLELLNTGGTPWLASGNYPVLVVQRWLDRQGRVVDEGPWVALPSHVPPGMFARFELRVESPPAPGQYQLQIDMVENGMAWFSERGIAPLLVPIAVDLAPGPRVCIVNGNCLANDAVGSHVLAQIVALRAGGYQPLLLTEFVDDRLPRDLRRAMFPISRYQFQNPDPRTQRAVDFFHNAAMVIVNYSTYYDLAELIREVRAAPVLFDYHGVTPPHIWGVERPGYQDLVRGVEHVGLVRFADYAVGHSQFTADELVATGCIAASRVSVQPYPVVERAAYVGPPDPALVEQYGLADKRVLLYVGRMARNKRIHDLVEALPAIQAQHPATVLLLVGDTAHAYAEYVGETKARAAELGVADSVIFTGPKNRSSIADYYRLCDIFVMASVHEGFCMPVIEAMACGKPVVAADSTALPSTLANAGLLFPAEDPAALAAHVCRLLDDLPPPSDGSDPLAHLGLGPASEAELAALRERTIAFVTPRYGVEVLGGAETGMRSWAEHLAGQGYRVEALATGVVDLTDWNDRLALGTSQVNGVTVRRFPVDPVDVGGFHGALQKAHRGEQVTRAEELRFIAGNLQSAALTRHLAQHRADYACVFFAPYLFGTSYLGAKAAPDQAIMVPCLHDEPAAYFGIFREMLEEAEAIFFNTEAESALASDKLAIANPYRRSVGFGFDEPLPGDAARFRLRYGLEGPIVLYSGRLEGGKNVPLLIESFIRYKEAHPGPLTLALTGNGSVTPPVRPDILPLGMVDLETLADAYAACLVLCQPSLNESFSIVMMEAWLQGRPCLAHSDCAVTRNHIERSAGGLLFHDSQSFAAALDQLLASEAAASAMGQRGRAYVRATYAWPVVLDKLLQGVVAHTRPRRLYNRLAQRGIRRALDFTHARFEEHLLNLVGRALRAAPAFDGIAGQRLGLAAQVARPSYSVRSGLPMVGKVVAWARRQLTSHLKEPYLDPVIADQERFNRDMVATLLPALEQSLREQRQLRRELEALRERVDGRGDAGAGEG